MDKQTIIDFCNSPNKSILIAIEIICAYCEDMGKKPEDIQLLVQALHMLPMDISYYTSIAIKYYKRKFILTDLYKGETFILTF